MQSYLPYIDRTTASELLQVVGSRLISDRRGGNSSAYIVDDYCVLKTGNIPLRDNGIDYPLHNVIESLHEFKENGVNVVPILGYIYNDDQIKDHINSSYTTGYIIQDRAKGAELWDSKKLPTWSSASQENLDYIIDMLNTLVHAPQEHFNKFVEDYRKIDNKLMIDPSKQSNFFYDQQLGFSFIDLKFTVQDKRWELQDLYGNDSHRFFISDILSATLLRNCFDSSLIPNDLLPIVTKGNQLICAKTINALMSAGITKENILDAFSSQETYNGSSSGFSAFGIDEEFVTNLFQKESPATIE